MTLNENQILFLQFILTEKGIKTAALQEEMIDHLAANIEGKMNQDILFHDAVDEAFAEFGEENIMVIRRHHQGIVRRKRLRKMAILSVFVLLLSIPSIFMITNHYTYSNENIPISHQEITPSAYTKEAFPKAIRSHMNVEPPEISPISSDYPIVSSFGRRMHPIKKVMKFHKGVDIKAPVGTSVVATSSGEVIDVKMDETGYGNHITIQHDESFKTLYAHLSKIVVKKGEKVRKGQKIGEVGSSGSSVLPHLHYEVIKKGEKVNPEEYIRM